jgi:hypothetical protein
MKIPTKCQDRVSSHMHSSGAVFTAIAPRIGAILEGSRSGAHYTIFTRGEPFWRHTRSPFIRSREKGKGPKVRDASAKGAM